MENLAKNVITDKQFLTDIFPVFVSNSLHYLVRTTLLLKGKLGL
jgi:hypothetical protein